MDSAGDRPSAGKPANGAGDAEFAELRRIIIGQDLKQLAALEQRLDNPEVRAKETATVLPAAVRSAPKGLRDAFEPMFDKQASAGNLRRHLSCDGPGDSRLRSGGHPGVRGVFEPDRRKERVVAFDPLAHRSARHRASVHRDSSVPQPALFG
jgi:hypothetical protein